MAHRYNPADHGKRKGEPVIGTLIVVTLALWVIYFFFSPMFNPPVVSFSYGHYLATGDYRCVRVYPDTVGDCSNLPLKYETRWVK